PRPIAAGVFGIARTIAAACGNAEERNRSVRPAMIEMTSTEEERFGASAARASTAECGFTAMTTTFAPRSVSAFGLSLPRRLARPDDELESREIALGGVERGCKNRFALPPGRRDAARQYQSMAEHDDAVLSPDIEVSDPQLLVDQCDQFLHLRQPRLRHLHVKSTSKVQRFNVVHPRERHLVIGPSAGDYETDLVFAGAFEWPVI